MIPVMPQVDRSGSNFLSDGFARWNGQMIKFDKPDTLLLYLGDTNEVPTLAHGEITLKAKLDAIEAHKILWDDIRRSHIEQGSSTLTKQKVRIECRKKKCQPNEYYGVTITRRNYGKISYKQRPYVNFSPADSQLGPECDANCEERAQWVADRINGDPARLATATVDTRTEGSETYHGVIIENNVAGSYLDFATVGFSGADELVPVARPSYQAKHLRELYGDELLPAGVSDEKVYNVVFIMAFVYTPQSTFGTSSNASIMGFQIPHAELTAVFFDPDNANSAAAFTELKDILDYNKTPKLYHSKLWSAASNPSVAYPFTIERVDAGDASAFNTAKTAYTTSNLLNFTRVLYENGTSYYQLASKSNAQPSPAAGGDVVSPGRVSADNMPCLDCQADE